MIKLYTNYRRTEINIHVIQEKEQSHSESLTQQVDVVHDLMIEQSSD